jgi:hypothetical protein
MIRSQACAALLLSLVSCGQDSYSEGGRLQEFPSVESGAADGTVPSGGAGAAGAAGETFGSGAASSDAGQAGGQGGSAD